MLIAVTIDTEILVEGLETEHLFVINQMTLIARQTGVLAGQRETRAIVSKIFIFPVDLPAVSNVALRALRRQHLRRKFANVRTLVTGFARLVQELWPMILWRFSQTRFRLRQGLIQFRHILASANDVTFRTRHIKMLAVDFVVRVPVVIEIMNLMPITLVVAGFALLRSRQGFRLVVREQVIVVVTAQTLCFSREPVPGVVFLFCGSGGLQHGRRLRVAFGAVDCLMLAVQFKTRDFVIEEFDLPLILIVTLRAIAGTIFRADIGFVKVVMAS